MSQKILIAAAAVCMLILVGTTSLLMIEQKSELSGEYQTATIKQWRDCQTGQSSYVNCNTSSDPRQNQQCYQAVSNLSQCQKNSMKCQSSNVLLRELNDDDLLPAAFFDCGRDCAQFSYANYQIMHAYSVEFYECSQVQSQQ